MKLAVYKKTTKGRNYLIYDGYEYYYKEQRKNWLCKKNYEVGCNGRLRKNKNGFYLVMDHTCIKKSKTEKTKQNFKKLKETKQQLKAENNRKDEEIKNVNKLSEKKISFQS
uniref:FLYWCH-type domain-containing protein n=1 Tax=Meloidogyne incognita TaxID=6306 RepID=A0A914LYY1_MELIC